MRKEQAYEFRKRMLEVHKPDICDKFKKCPEGYFELTDNITIYIEKSAGEVVKTAVYDFVDFLDTSVNISARISKIIDDFGSGDIKIMLAENAGLNLGDAAGYQGFLIRTSDKVEIYAYDERGAAQALYYIEDIISFEQGPFIERGEVARKAMFSPQMVHSGYGFDEFPDEYLSAIAHEGRDAILVYTMDANLTPSGYMNFNELIDRAARYGIDVYAYSYLKSSVSPDSPDAEAFYDRNYGKLFRMCPRLKGVTLVGEAVEFPSRDPHVAKGRYYDYTSEGILHGKPSSGTYPCEDYPDWLNILKKVIKKHNPDADIVLWSYNWGFQPEEARVKLIENLPSDVALLATFEMFEPRRIGEAVTHCADYTLSFVGPGKYFESEAVAAKKSGVRLYSMTNTGGLTWDFGVIPYQPMPYQWIKRYEAMKQAKENWGLSGLMECHHFGFYPSFISKLSKFAFMEPSVSMTEILEKILKAEYGRENFEKVDSALKLWSEAINYYTPSNADQGGAFRIGPSFPFYLYRTGTIPHDVERDVRNPMFGTRMCSGSGTATEYGWGYGPDARDSVPSIRVPEELKSLEKMSKLMNDGLEILKEAQAENENLSRLINLGEFMVRCITTGINAKKWYLLRMKFFAESSKEVLVNLLDEMETLLNSEIENAEETIPIVEVDSRLGWEPRMLYITDREHLQWKVAQVKGVIAYEIGVYRKSLEKLF